MKAFLLAAGEGRRLRPLTERTPKCLVPICGTPLLGIWLRLLERHGIHSVLVNTHYLPEQVEAFLRSWPTSIDVITSHEPHMLGSAGTVLANRAFVGDNPSFLVIYADNLSNVDVTAMVRFHAGRSEPLTIGIVPTDRPREKGTVVLDPDGRVVAFEEKAEHPRSNLSNTGIYVARTSVFEEWRSFHRGEPLDFGCDVLPRMVPRIAAYHIPEFLVDIGTHEAYARAQVAWQSLQATARPADSERGDGRPALLEHGR